MFITIPNCVEQRFVTGSWKYPIVIPNGPVFALGSDKTTTLLGFHALSGSDNTGCFAGTAKLTFWKAFQNAAIIKALAKLGTASEIDSGTMLIWNNSSVRDSSHRTKETEMVAIQKETSRV